MVRTKKAILLGDGMVIVTPPSTPGSRAAQLAARSSSAAHISGSIAVVADRAAHTAILGNTLAINPTIKRGPQEKMPIFNSPLDQF